MVSKIAILWLNPATVYVLCPNSVPCFFVCNMFKTDSLVHNSDHLNVYFLLSIMIVITWQHVTLDLLIYYPTVFTNTEVLTDKCMFIRSW